MEKVKISDINILIDGKRAAGVEKVSIVIDPAMSANVVAIVDIVEVTKGFGSGRKTKIYEFQNMRDTVLRLLTPTEPCDEEEVSEEK